MLRDEATEKLLAAVEDEPVAEVTIAVDHGVFTARFATRHVEIEGADKNNLTDALVSLAEVIGDR